MSVPVFLTPISASLVVVASAVLFTGLAMAWRSGWAARGIWSPRWFVFLSGGVNAAAGLLWAWLGGVDAGSTEPHSISHAVLFGLFAQYGFLASGSDAKGWLIAKENTWPPVAAGVISLVGLSTLSGAAVLPVSSGGLVVLGICILIFGAAGGFLYGLTGLITGGMGVWLSYLLLVQGHYGGLFLLLLAALFSARSAFGMGFGDVRMAGVTAATLYFLPIEGVLIGLIAFLVLTMGWTIADDRKQVAGKGILSRKIPLAPPFCAAFAIAAIASVAALH